MSMDKVELALIKIVSVVRRKINDWVPKEGKAAEDCQRFLREGRFNSGIHNRDSASNGDMNGYTGGSSLQRQDSTSSSSSFDRIDVAGSFSGPHESAQPSSDDLPATVRKFSRPSALYRNLSLLIIWNATDYDLLAFAHRLDLSKTLNLLAPLAGEECPLRLFLQVRNRPFLSNQAIESQSSILRL